MLPGIALLFAVASGHLGWIDDNYNKAVTEAKSRHVPVFVEVWAPW